MKTDYCTRAVPSVPSHPHHLPLFTLSPFLTSRPVLSDNIYQQCGHHAVAVRLLSLPRYTAIP